MTLTERFIEIDEGPVARKTILLAALSLIGHLLDWAFLHFHLRGEPSYDLGLLDAVMGIGTAALLLLLAIAALAHRTGRGDAATPYLTAVLLPVPFLGMQAIFGQWTSTMFLLLPITCLLMVLWYGVRPALTMYLVNVIVTSTVGSLQSFGELRYAPLVEDVSLSALKDPPWTTANTIPVQTVFWLTFALCALVVSARRLQSRRLDEAHENLARGHELIKRYVPAQVVESVMKTPDAVPAADHERRRLTIFFSDLVGFTDISEELEPEDLARVLSEYFTEMTRIADRHGGTIDELQGDAILILFGAPDQTDDRDHAVRAVRMATEMQLAMASLNAAWERAGIPVSLAVRMGINTGVVTVGNFGSAQRTKYAALGKHVNLAARLQSHCTPGSVVLGHATWLLVRDDVACTPLGEVALKGIVNPVRIYSPKELVPNPL